MEPPTKDRPQSLVGYRTNEEWNQLLAEIATVIEDLENLDDPELRAKVFHALQSIDALHREALNRLVRLFKEGVLEQVATDPAIRTMMEMYGLLPAAPAEGKTWDFLTPEERAAGPRTSSSKRQSNPPAVEPIAEPAVYPHWSPAPLNRTVSDGEAVIVQTDDGAILLAKVEGVLRAVSASCPTHGGAMHGGTLNHVSWICPLGAGCVYDTRTGARLGGGPGLIAFAVRQAEDGNVLIGIGMPYDPKLPAF
jgi:nitrite reductase/ring-hydroxylating ferredoxin subunit